MNKIENSSLYHLIMETLTKGVPINTKGKSPGFDISNDKRKYIHNAFQNVISMASIHKELLVTQSLLKIDLNSKALDECGVSNADYLKLLLSHKFIKTSTILDRSIIFVSDIFRLGVPHKSATLKNLRENEFTKHTESYKILHEFNKQITDLITTRNKIVHRGELEDDLVDIIYGSEYMYQFVEGPSLKERESTLKAVFEYKKLELKDNNEMVESFLLSLFDSLIPVFNEKIRLFDKY